MELLLDTLTIFGISPIAVAIIRINKPINPEKYKTMAPIKTIIKMLRIE